MWPNTLDPLKAIPGVDISTGEFRVSGATPRDVNEAINRIANVVNSVTTANAYWEYVGRDARRDRFRDSLFMVRWSEGPPRKPSQGLR